MQLRHMLGGLFAATLAISPALAQAENQDPVCQDQGDQFIECQGLTTVTTVAVVAVDPEGGPLTCFWVACPLVFVTDPTSPTTDVIVDTSMSCSVRCGLRYDIVDPLGGKCTGGVYINIVPGSEGCSPGYWKNHLQAWEDTPFAPSDDFDATFGVNAFTPNKTLGQAVALGGGGLNKLARSAVPALLNAANPDVSYPLAVGQILLQVHDAILAGQYEPLASTLDSYNNLGCPLGNCGGGSGGGGGGGHGGGHHGGGSGGGGSGGSWGGGWSGGWGHGHGGSSGGGCGH